MGKRGSSFNLPAIIDNMLKICTTPFVQEPWTQYDTGDRRSEGLKRGEWKCKEELKQHMVLKKIHFKFQIFKNSEKMRAN